eukprot:7965492-Pyramimonas_sp.AAC.2
MPAGRLAFRDSPSAHPDTTSKKRDWKEGPRQTCRAAGATKAIMRETSRGFFEQHWGHRSGSDRVKDIVAWLAMPVGRS